MESLIAVLPVRTPAPYQGGKKVLSPRIVPILGQIPHRTYVEPFVGMGSIFFRRDRRPPAEVINDLSGDVANLFRILQRHYQAFMDLLKWQLTSRADFDRLRATDVAGLTDLERAARFLYLQRLSFGGKVQGRTFGVDRRTPGRFDITKLAGQLEEIHERLAGVTIEQLPYATVIRRYDSAETLFYLDPPYWDCEDDYGDGFAREDFLVLAEQLERIAGHFLLSINDTPGARAVFARFRIVAVPVTYSIGSRHGGGQRAGELLISNLSDDLAEIAGIGRGIASPARAENDA